MLEKETTTPEYYPLSLNALTNACNQKSNREPVMTLSEIEVQEVIDELMAMNLVSDQGAFSGRVAKYSHRFCNTEFGSLQFTSQQRAIICVMLLRGAQTPGELRTRTNRLADFTNVTEVETALTQLQNLNDHQYVTKLAREPGKRESRYMHLFTDKSISNENSNEGCDSNSDSSHDIRIDAETSKSLLTRIETLEQQVTTLTAKLDELLN
jgi:uncharacterized protein YceH (UPF0502 family)